MTPTLEVDTDHVSERIVSEIAALDETDPTALPPLFDTIDPDALTSMFAATASGTSRSGRVEFSYAGYDVTIVFEEDPIVTIE